MHPSTTPQIPAPDNGTRTRLVGAEKVAVLLLALGKPKATKVLQEFDASSIAAIRAAAARLRPVSANDLRTLVDEFAIAFSGGIDFIGTPEEVEKLLSEVTPEDPVEEDIDEMLFGIEEPIWDRLSELKPEILSEYIEKEHPQIGAQIITRMNSDLSASTLALLPSQFRNELLQRMLNSETVTDFAMKAIESGLRADLLEAKAGGDNCGETANLLNKLEKEQQEDLLRELALSNPDQAKTLRTMLFSFEDVAILAQKDRIALFDAVPAESVILALQDADSHLQELILGALAARARRVVEAELRSGGNASPKDVGDARRAIANMVLEMAAEGKLEIPTDAEV